MAEPHGRRERMRSAIAATWCARSHGSCSYLEGATGTSDQLRNGYDRSVPGRRPSARPRSGSPPIRSIDPATNLRRLGRQSKTTDRAAVPQLDNPDGPVVPSELQRRIHPTSARTGVTAMTRLGPLRRRELGHGAIVPPVASRDEYGVVAEAVAEPARARHLGLGSRRATPLLAGRRIDAGQRAYESADGPSPGPSPSNFTRFSSTRWRRLGVPGGAHAGRARQRRGSIPESSAIAAGRSRRPRSASPWAARCRRT